MAARSAKEKTTGGKAAGRNAAKQRFGAHLSIAGGFENAFTKGVEVECDCLQIFVKNQKQWQAKPFTDDVINRYVQAQKETGLTPVVAHAGYLINIASPDAALRTRSMNALTDELERCEALGIRDLVLHPGAHMGEGYDEGIARVASALDEVHERCAGFQAGVLLETTAGQGTSIGSEIEHLQQIIAAVAAPERLCVCLDTCHLFAAGYNIAQRDGYDETIDTLDRLLGLDRVRCIHMNDSKTKCGSHVDRHEHLGKGEIGRDAFRWIVTDARLTAIPKILETPKGEDGRGIDHDLATIRKLRRWADGK